MRLRLLFLSCLALQLSCGNPGPQPAGTDVSVPSGSELLLLGGQSGDGTGYQPALTPTDDFDSDQSNCGISGPGTELASLDAFASELGFSGNDVLAWVQGGVDSSLSWAPDGSLQTAPESGNGRLRIEFQTVNAVARLVVPDDEPNPGEEPPPVACPPWLEVDVVARVTTPAGNLADQFITTLRAARPFIVSFTGTLNAAALEGQLTVDAGLMADRPSSLELNGVLSEEGSFGQLFALYPSQGTEPLRRSVALWPALGDCSFSGVPLGVAVADSTPVLGRTVQSWQDAGRSLEGLSLQWSDGGSTRLSLKTMLIGKACLWTSWYQPLQALNIGVDLMTQTEDGRWLAQYPGRVELFSEAGLAPVESILVSVDVPPSESGLLGLGALPVASADSLNLDLRVTLGDDERPTEGRLRVEARRETSCEELGNGPDATSVDECLASQQSRLLRANIEGQAR